VSVKLHVPTALTPERDFGTQLIGDWVGPKPVFILWIRDKSLTPAGIWILAVQPVARLYTDWAIHASKIIQELSEPLQNSLTLEMAIENVLQKRRKNLKIWRGLVPKAAAILYVVVITFCISTSYTHRDTHAYARMFTVYMQRGTKVVYTIQHTECLLSVHFCSTLRMSVDDLYQSVQHISTWKNICLNNLLVIRILCTQIISVDKLHSVYIFFGLFI
jgi:hypothetical protein